MSDSWMPSLRVNISRDDFDRLPRHPAYRYEYFNDVAHLAPWPRYYHAQLDLPRFRAKTHHQSEPTVRPVCYEDLNALIPVFGSAFGHLQPFGSLDQTSLRLAADQCLRRTFNGGDGVFVGSASFAAELNETIIGAIFITLLPGGDSGERDSYHWYGPPPPALWNQTLGQPHLTWIFVDRLGQGSGLGTRLLQQVADVLVQQGYKTLWTTFLMGNDSSMLWHWRNGFELFSHPSSKRQLG